MTKMRSLLIASAVAAAMGVDTFHTGATISPAPYVPEYKARSAAEIERRRAAADAKRARRAAKRLRSE